MKRKMKCAPLVLVILLTLSACGGGPPQGAGGGGTPDASQGAQPPEGGQLAVRIQRDGDAVAVLCEGEAVADFVKKAPKKEDNQFSIQFDGADGGRYSLSFQYPSGDEEPMGSWSNLKAQNHRSTWDGDGALRFAVEGNTATWILSGLDFSMDGVERLHLYAVAGDWEKPIFTENMPLSQVERSEGISDLPDAGLPFEIAGEYAPWNEGSLTPCLLVEPLHGGYVLTYGDYVSATIGPDLEDAQNGVVTLSGPVAQGPTDEVLEFHVRFREEWGDLAASLTILEPANNAGSTRIDDNLFRFPVRTGAYRAMDYETKTPVTVMELEYDKGQFRFLVDGRYRSDWVAPTEAYIQVYRFSHVSFTDLTGEKSALLGSVSLNLNHGRPYSYATVEVGTDVNVPYMMTAYSPIDGDYTFPYTGTYLPDPDADEAHTIEVTETGLTVDGRYKMDYTVEGVLYGWSMHRLTDTVTGESRDATLQLRVLDDESYALLVSSYDGSFMAQAIRKH